jgi:hypothetical protein
MKNNDLEAMRNLDKLPLPVAKEVAKSWMVKPKTKNGIYRYNNLLLDIERSPSSEKLMLTMWNVILAGEGLAVPNSKWQQDHAKHLYT